MGSAIINGVKKGSDIEILAFDVNSERLGQLPVTSCATESEVVEKCRYVLLAVKPQVLKMCLIPLLRRLDPRPFLFRSVREFRLNLFAKSSEILMLR